MKSGFNRRQFIRTAASSTILGTEVSRAADVSGVSLILDPKDPVAGSSQARWAAAELEKALSACGVSVERCSTPKVAKAGDLWILAAGANFPVARDILRSSRMTVAQLPEALALVASTFEGHKSVLACGYDSRGLVYALLDLSDRVAHSDDALASLRAVASMTEQPANRVRSLMRLFTSDVEDKPWYNDGEMWPAYLTNLATQRFNRFQIAFGIGYDFIRQVTDAYFLFTYPFLVSVPGYNVRVPQLPDAERDRNLEMLKFISQETVARGMEFQLGLWMHGYVWIDSPHPNYTIEGLTAQTHAPYCRDALRLILNECPAISGVTFRVHGESGVEEGNYDFWKTVFDGVATCGRKVEIDMHPKGLDKTMLEVALATKQPVKVSPKFWAEHMGMTYHQADIRELERPKAGRKASALMKLSAGSRSFLRYGYGDLLAEDRKFGVVHRIWPGTQRLLLWGDPESAAAYSRAFSFCGSDGVDICEPLSFKGRRGSGIAGDRCAYADTTLRPRWDWQKYLYSTRVWGRALYNPECDAEVWRRYMQRNFGNGATHVGAALACASRILPIITTAHGTSAGNNTYWPEIYTNQSLFDAEHWQPYSDTPSPRVFGNVSPLDPQLFSRINDFADQLLSGKRDGKYSPLEVAQWLEDYAQTAREKLARANASCNSKEAAACRRLIIDVGMQAGIGEFFGAKFRSGMLYRIYEKTGDPAALEACLAQYRKARAAWAALANEAKGVYMSDITVGEHPQLRGHWLDRLAAIDQDIAGLGAKLGSAKTGIAQPEATRAIKEILARPERRAGTCRHVPPARYQRSQAVIIECSLDKRPTAVSLYYRHVNQAERYTSVVMEVHDKQFRATIPASYTDSPYPLEYYFEVTEAAEKVWLYPGFNAELNNQPYFVVRQA